MASTDQRGISTNNFPVWRIDQPMVILINTTIIANTITANGRIEHIYVTTGDCDGSETQVLTIVDDNSVTLYTSAALAESSTHKLDVSVLVAGELTVTLTSPNPQSAAVTNALYIYGV